MPAAAAKAGRSWYLDETYVKVGGTWRYLYRAIDRDGNLVDSMLSEQRDRAAARRFLRRLVDIAVRKLARVTTDQHPAYGKAIRWILGRKVLHRQNQYLYNRIEQDHRAMQEEPTDADLVARHPSALPSAEGLV